MLAKKHKYGPDEQLISTVVAEGSVLDGNLKAPAYVRIDGQCNGDVTVEEGLILGEKGVINGNIVTKEIVVHGTVNGHIRAHTLELRSTGRITGDVSLQILEVAPGGTHNGKISMNGVADLLEDTPPELEEA